MRDRSVSMQYRALYSGVRRDKMAGDAHENAAIYYNCKMKMYVYST